MSSRSSRYAVGIDLGTTNIAVAYRELSTEAGIQAFGIDQLISHGQVTPRPILPAALYLPALEEILDSDTCLPWANPQGDANPILGEFALELGAKTPNRLVHSAKSWLCHNNVDRYDPILPWLAP